MATAGLPANKNDYVDVDKVAGLPFRFFPEDELSNYIDSLITYWHMGTKLEFKNILNRYILKSSKRKFSEAFLLKYIEYFYLDDLRDKYEYELISGEYPN